MKKLKVERILIWARNLSMCLGLVLLNYCAVDFQDLTDTSSSSTSTTSSSSTPTVTYIDQTDDDGTSTGFGGGSHTGTTYSSDVLTLNTTTNNAELDESWTPQWSSIIGYWKFDETGWNGTADEVVDSKGTNHGVRVGDATTTSSAKIGSYSASIPGSNDYVLFNSSGIDNNLSNFSLSIWFKTSSATDQVLYWEAALNARGFWSRVEPGSSRIRLYSGATGTSNIVATTEAYNNGKWQHLIYTMSGGNIGRVYINGVLAAETTSNIGAGATTDVGRLGLKPDLSNDFNGSIDDVAIWNTPLTADEVALIHSRQSAKYAGEFQSRVMDSLSASSSWTNLDWVTTLPFAKELPDGGGSANSESSSSYTSLANSTLMDGLVGLWHLNGTEGIIADDALIADTSGNGYNGAAKDSDGTNTIAYVQGSLGQGVQFDGANDYIELNSPIAPPTALSLSVWVKRMGDGIGWPRFFINTEVNESITITEHGTLASGILFRLVKSNIFTDKTAPAGTLVDYQWQHLIFRWDGAWMDIYVDGVKNGASIAFAGPIDPVTATNGYIGGDSATNFNGAIDEVAIWNRALSTDEILQLYRRGANRIKYQIRSCANSDCSDQDAITPGFGWKGPGGNYLTNFSELYNNSSVSATCGTTIQCFMSELSLDGDVLTSLPSLFFSNFNTDGIGNSSAHPSGKRYFQYRTFLESDDENSLCTGATTCMPELKSVEIGPAHAL